MILGITGGSGCGKTTLLNMIREAGGLVLDCDAVYHELLQTDKAMLTAIEARFPRTVEEGVLQRKKLGAIVFSDPDALADLNRITHSAVKAEVQRQLALGPELAFVVAQILYPQTHLFHDFPVDSLLYGFSYFRIACQKRIMCIGSARVFAQQKPVPIGHRYDDSGIDPGEDHVAALYAAEHPFLAVMLRGRTAAAAKAVAAVPVI